MLRTLRIPSRIVNGFRSGEFNDVNGSYIIRERDAHSWVEAYMPAYGWMTLDPTPADPVATGAAWDRLQLYLDAAAEFWREWVINYDFLHQRALTTTATRQGLHAFSRLRLWTRHLDSELLRQCQNARRRLWQSPLRWSAALLAFAGILLLVTARKKVALALRNLRLSRGPARAPEAFASLWYQRMLRLLARRGMPKSPAQTPSEFAAAIPEPALRRSVSEFTEHYQRARFGSSSEDAGKLPGLYQEIER
jgi:hypothetical protein